MRVGLLWFDDKQESDFLAKVEQAAQHYEHKYGVRPTECLVHPSMLFGGPTDPMVVQHAGIAIKASNTVLPHHFWLGGESDLIPTMGLDTWQDDGGR